MKLSKEERSHAASLPSLCSSYLSKKSSNNKFSDKWFTLTEEALYLKNKHQSSKVRGMISLENTRVLFQVKQPALFDIFGEEDLPVDAPGSMRDDLDDCSSIIALQSEGEYDIEDSNCQNMSNSQNTTIYQITLIKGRKFTTLSTQSFSSFKKWRKHLTNICLTTSMSPDFMLSPIKFDICVPSTKESEFIFLANTHDSELYPALKLEMSQVNQVKMIPFLNNRMSWNIK